MKANSPDRNEVSKVSNMNRRTCFKAFLTVGMAGIIGIFGCGRKDKMNEIDRVRHEAENKEKEKKQ